ncbi:MAG: hypothetical protein PHH00_01470 [Candidatus Nanoarchaeia archaeon]|nr:hypothetical protein [Candidatus Nanoarchaeia archaeon]
MNKRGQVYLIAAIIIITIAAGLITISNYVSSHQTQDIYYLRDEIKIESSRVMDYAALNSANFKNTMINFSEQYMNNTRGNNFYFVLGSETSMTFLAYQSFNATIFLDGADKTSDVGIGRIYIGNSFDPGANVTLGINGNDYVFKLNVGNNYGFIISGEKGGQDYIARG